MKVKKVLGGIGAATLIFGGMAYCGVSCAYRKGINSLHEDVEKQQKAHRDAIKAGAPDLFPDRNNKSLRVVITKDDKNQLVHIVYLRGGNTAEIERDGIHFVDENGNKSKDPIPNSPRNPDPADPAYGGPVMFVGGNIAQRNGVTVVYDSKGNLTEEGKQLIYQVNGWGVNSAKLLNAMRAPEIADRSKSGIDLRMLSPLDYCHVPFRQANIRPLLGLTPPFKSMEKEFAENKRKIDFCATK